MRPTAAMALNYQTLWFDEKNGVPYCFGGEKSGPTQLPDAKPSSESIWGFSPDNHGSGSWAEYLGSTADKPFPETTAYSSHGFSGTDGMNGHYSGGYITPSSSSSVALPWVASEAVPGLVTFSFASLNLTNDINVAWLSTSDSAVSPIRVVHVPLCGSAGILLALGGGSAQTETGGPFSNISIFDLETKKWYWPTATGSVSYPRSDFCAVGAQAQDNSTFEM